ncbi:MAG: DUF6340 family protein [Fulvivirga sp.]
MRPITLVLIIACLASCSQSIVINKTLPAEFVLNSDEIIIVENKFDVSTLDLGSAEERKLNVYSSGISALLKKLESELTQREGVSVIMLDSGIFQNTPAAAFDNTIDSVCNSTSGNFYFVLKEYTLEMDQTGVEKDEDGDKIASYDLLATAKFDLYSCETGQKVKDFDQSARVFYENRVVQSGLLARGPSLKKADEEAVVVSEDLAIFLIDRFHPVEIQKELHYYSGKSMKEAANLINNEDYAAALTTLLRLAENSDNTIAGEAANNLFVVYEILGNSDQSEYWYNQAKKLDQLHSLNQLDY